MSHLPASSLSAVSLVSKRFYTLVTTPHAWRVAFSRFFAGQDAVEDLLEFQGNRRGSDHESHDQLRAQQRFFTRLTALASWRSEYILRTRLLRSLARGKPSQIAPGHGASSRANSAANNANAVVTYNSQLFSTINHIHATFNGGKKSPRFIHGTDETGSACTSDPNIGKIDNWGLSDPQSLPQFADLFPGDELYGLGQGLVIGVPNVMDVSQPFGMVYGEGFPGGHAYFRSSGEMRGRFLLNTTGPPEPQIGIPQIPSASEAICAVWLAKSPVIPNITEGLVGIMTGSSCGVITTYSLGSDNLKDYRLNKGEITARWMVSPGVPIVAISVDESYNASRKTAGRIWAVALNALGEVYYLTETPQRDAEKAIRLVEGNLAVAAWETGRNAYWNIVEPTRRVAREDPYQEAEFDGSYSPRSSSKSMNLSREQLVAETKEIQKFLALSPAHFRKVCHGWDMQRRLEVDFGGDDGKGAGEHIVVIDCGVDGLGQAQVKRYTRLNSEQASFDDYPLPKTPPMAPATPSMASLFGGGSTQKISMPQTHSPKQSNTPRDHVRDAALLVEEWRASIMSLQDSGSIEISTSAIDMSTFALLTAMEDPLLTLSGTSSVSSPFATPVMDGSFSLSDVPGYRARYLAVGNKAGTVILWDMRGPQSSNSAIVNELHPLRTIQTDSPQVSCLALSALYIIHGGNDGLVQSWDPLASTLQPIRTLNSRFSSRARRRLVQAEASVQGVGINLYAAGAITIDPDPTVLRGMVSLGTHLRYWSYSSTAADQVSSKKRKIRRSNERGSNGGPDRFSSTGRGALMDYIATEQEELKKEKERRHREEVRLHGRFGVGFAGMTDEEALRYAEMMSQETFQKDQERALSDVEVTASSSAQLQSAFSSDTVTPDGSVAGQSSPPKKYKTEDELEHDIEEAIRLSLLDGVDDGGRSPRASGSGEYDIPIIYKQKKSRRSASSSPSTSQASRSRAKLPSSKMKGPIAVDDLEFALQLSLAEEQSRRMESTGDEFPMLEDVNEVKGKGKGRAV